MIDGTVFVYIDIGGQPQLVGRLWSRVRRERESASFEYDPTWLNHPDRFPLEPALMLVDGAQHTAAEKALFGALGDSAPDRWGRTLMRRAERQRARDGKRPPQTLFEIDYLLRVSDEARQGALRFALQPDGPFLAESGKNSIPPLVELPGLLAATESIEDDDGDIDDLRLLLAPGSSLGGARPKASVRERDGSLTIAKFPRKEDEVQAVLWEALALTLAGKAGIPVPEWRIETVAGRAVLLLKRFDRNGKQRIPFLSAMSMLGAQDNELHSYMEIADAIRRQGAAANDDRAQLWRRMVFNVLISNTDDHLRNHGFLYSGPNGWCLSPAYDLNPVPVDIKPRVLSTSIDLEDAAASMELAFEVAGYFGLKAGQARAIATEVAQVVSTWRKEAERLGLQREVARMASAFEHDDLRRALG